MNIIRAPRPHSNFYILDKTISEDKRLSWAARGLLIFLLGKPDNWQTSPSALMNEVASSTRSTGRDATYGLLDELMAVGYVERVIERVAGKVVGSRYVVRESPLPEIQESEPLPEKPYPAEPYPAKPTQVSTDSKQGLNTQQELSNSSAPAKAKRKVKPDAVTFDRELSAFAGIGIEQIAAWREAFPLIDIERQVLRAALWCAANPDRAPKARCTRFLNSWMARARPESAIPTTQQQRTPNRYERARMMTEALTGKRIDEQRTTGDNRDVIDADAREIHE